MKIPIILLNYNSFPDCRKCVSFLKRQEGIDIEIIIVDNCSSCEGEQETVRQFCQEQGCIFIQADENRGYNAGNNIGLRYASEKGYKYALIANPDMEFPQVDYVKTLADIMEKDEQIVVCGSDIVTPEGWHQNPQRGVKYSEELFWFITTLRNLKSKKWFSEDYTKSAFCQKVSGCCFLIRIEFLNRIKFFDENVFLYSEEAILGKQVQSCNKKMYYCSEAQAIHRHIKSEKGDPKKRMQILFTSREYYLRKYSNYKGIKLQVLLLSRAIQKLFYGIK